MITSEFETKEDGLYLVEKKNGVIIHETKREEQPPARSLSRYWFTLRFTLQEQAAINLSTDGVVMSFRELLKMVPKDMVNLDDPLLIEALEYFVSIGILQNNRLQDIFADAMGRELEQ